MSVAPPRPSISAVIPAFNESKNPFFAEALARLAAAPEAPEVIVVDGGSQDDTRAIVRGFGLEPLELVGANRARRLNAGLAKARGDWLILHHPRSVLAPEALAQLTALAAPAWGGFTHRFRDATAGLSFTSWYSNHIRLAVGGIVYLDHCVFVHRSLFAAHGPVPERDIFEDTELSRALRRAGPPVRLAAVSETSPIRFVTNGFWRQSAMNQWLKVRYHLRASDKAMNRVYEKRLNLNEVVDEDGDGNGADGGKKERAPGRGS